VALVLIKTYKTLSTINFPCYVLPKGSVYSRDGILFLNGKIIDDRNMKGETLGVRRVQTPQKNLMRLNKSITEPIGIIKSIGTGRYIDTFGNIFLYKKTKFAKVIYHKIKKTDKKINSSILWVHGVSFPFVIPRPPPAEFRWAGILYNNSKPWLLYNYATERLKSFRRKV
jgi:hypothetical protein